MIDDNEPGNKFQIFLGNLCKYFDVEVEYSGFGNVDEPATSKKLEKYCRFEIIMPKNINEALSWVDCKDIFPDIIIIDMLWPGDSIGDVNGGVKIVKKIKLEKQSDSIICSNTTAFVDLIDTLVELGVEHRILRLDTYQNLEKYLPVHFRKIAEKYFHSGTTVEVNKIKELLTRVNDNGILLSDDQLLEESIFLCGQEWKVRHFLLTSWQPGQKKYHKVRASLEKLVRGTRGPRKGPWVKGLLSRYYQLKENNPDEFSKMWEDVKIIVGKFLDGAFDYLEDRDKLDCEFFTTGKKDFGTIRDDELKKWLRKILTHRLIILFEAASNKDNRIVWYDAENMENSFSLKPGFKASFQIRQMSQHLDTYLGLERKDYINIKMSDGTPSEEYVEILFENLLPEETEWLRDNKPEISIAIHERFPHLFTIMEVLVKHIKNNRNSFKNYSFYSKGLTEITLNECESNLQYLLEEDKNDSVATLVYNVHIMLDDYPSQEFGKLPERFKQGEECLFAKIDGKKVELIS
jgi:hypothetical protein